MESSHTPSTYRRRTRMKPQPRVESTAPAAPKRKRRNRPRPTPRWLKQPKDGPEGMAQRRCLMVLSVLSGEKPVTDAIAEANISRPLYYLWEERVLKAMVRCLMPGADAEDSTAVSLQEQLAAAEAKVKRLETEKRRAERLLLLTRKLVKPGPMTQGPAGPRRRRGSTKAGLAASTSGATRPATTPSPDTSPTVPTGATPP